MSKIFVANITIEAKTALKIGSKNADFLQDSPIQKDWNNLPMILGTSIAGVLRKELDKENANILFGDEDSNKKDAKGSKTIISNALILDENEKVNETLLLNKSAFLQKITILPIREHNAINSKGVTIDKSKYDEEVIYKGTRFKFRIEMIESCEDEFNKVLDLLFLNTFRIGAGSSKGLGQVEVVNISYDKFDTSSKEYENLTSSLNEAFSNSYTKKDMKNNSYIKYELKLTPDDFFMFGSGFGDDEDMTSVYEKVVDYKNKKLTDEKVLIPASSIKGSISHRTTYHYNLLNEIFIDNENKTPFEVVESIFGAKKDKDKDKEGFKGNILISDLYLDNTFTKVFDHVSIDRFTGGAIDSALFQEKTITTNEEFSLEILIKNIDDKKAMEAFEKTLKEITTGMLSLGGATTKGHGVFSGIVLRNGVQI
jgi:CRISPR/Cas system CSM-associated protein Csm3 (group 7 of RAMP superfamily)